MWATNSRFLSRPYIRAARVIISASLGLATAANVFSTSVNMIALMPIMNPANSNIKYGNRSPIMDNKFDDFCAP